MSLKTELETLRAAFIARAPAEIRNAMTQSEQDLAASGILDRVLRAGHRAPDFTLPDVHGKDVKLSTMLAKGPVVLSFYRGGWCPYCNLELRALQSSLPTIEQLGASLIAISPQTPDESLSTSEKNALGYPVLSDLGSHVARAYGIAFDLASSLRPIYANFGHALPDRNGDDSWVLPIPATYVIDRDGIIAMAFIDIDYRNRLDPEDVIITLENLNRGRAA